MREISLENWKSSYTDNYLVVITVIGDIVGSDLWTSNEMLMFENVNHIRIWDNANKDWGNNYGIFSESRSVTNDLKVYLEIYE